MDEPASALDPIATARIEELIRELCDGLHDRHRDPLDAAGRPRLRHDGVLLHGRADRARRHEAIFTKPKRSKTEDYITGRFG
jgi:phosphate transport system ATP-binding protein